LNLTELGLLVEIRTYRFLTNQLKVPFNWKALYTFISEELSVEQKEKGPEQEEGQFCGRQHRCAGAVASGVTGVASEASALRLVVDVSRVRGHLRRVFSAPDA